MSLLTYSTPYIWSLFASRHLKILSCIYPTNGILTVSTVITFEYIPFRLSNIFMMYNCNIIRNVLIKLGYVSITINVVNTPVIIT
ncbi:hypothetical protein PBCV1_a569R [Paramecium bursaria Chlorella virus 1]|uniref:Uncharacterized protein n=1 Tax=Paramecium bursaria Chlorella virus 1 TaxID=10506 RepID=O41051_PBCV1|nr:hypothetical protein PBCV1_a569R [Paramecium bursaria Chlorella virus 1]AAC97004.1 hypothetical protein [Paramecium bursaria Chlorella virus 1]